MWHSPAMVSLDSNTPSLGVLLVNLGTPDSPKTSDVRRYLREFLSDPEVINIPAIPRWLLLNFVILPFRPRRSAAAYEKIWTEHGSPLAYHGKELRDQLERLTGPDTRVSLGMRYGSPSIETGLKALIDAGVERIVALPLYPQYASASTRSSQSRIFEVARGIPDCPPIRTIGAFYDHPAFIDAAANVARPGLASFAPDHVVFSFHGLPQDQVQALDTSGQHCFARENCCDQVADANRNCYRAHCFATARALVAALDLAPETWSIAFQSRLGRQQWIEPDLVAHLPELAARGIKRVAIACPSFVADCLETIEEIGIRANAQWQELGGEALHLVPCVNADPSWVSGVAKLIAEDPA
jgi:ferrochelatase